MVPGGAFGAKARSAQTPLLQLVESKLMLAVALRGDYEANSTRTRPFFSRGIFCHLALVVLPFTRDGSIPAWLVFALGKSIILL